ncbi:Na/Pi cotransporter family protein [Rubellimicrobium arenae]|uniref:Na/Pi cotransporter family protein n=1 Tax=Rubellimicrobium arenae TaxID=2817372 RepID=UPI001B31025B|nr:Na/Pi cotransporter family protein [Rubellimicrobium arenae]
MTSTIILLDLLGAAALLLWGLGMVKSGILAAFGASLRHGIARGTGNRVAAAASGLLVTLAVQSSTATAMITASFTARGLIEGRMAQAVLLGANLGTALTAVALSFDVHWLAPAFTLAGVAVHARSRLGRGQGIGKGLIGLGLMLFALAQLGAATDPLRESPVLVTLLGALADAPAFAVVFAAGLAVAASSSLAVVLFVSALSVAGNLPPALALALVAGANLGGAIPPCLAAMTDGIEAQRVTRANLAVRGAGAALVTLTANWLGPWLQSWAPGTPSLPVVAHVGFNAALLLVFLPALGPLDRLTRRLLPGAPTERTAASHLDDSALEMPSLALAGAVREALRIGDTVAAMMERTVAAFRSDDPAVRRATSELDDRVDAMLAEVKMYLARLNARDLSVGEKRRSEDIMSYAINLEHVGDILDRDLAGMAEKKAARQVRFSEQGEREILEFCRKTIANLELAQSVFLSRDVSLARRLASEKVQVRRLEEQSQRRHLDRLRAGQPETLATSSLHLDILRDLKRVNAHIASVAYPILAEAGELGESRVLSIRDAPDGAVRIPSP